MFNLVLSSFLVVVALSIISGFLGPFVIWKNISYFGDTLSHSALLGLVIGSAFDYIPEFISIFILAIFTSFILLRITYLKDTALSVVNSISMALAIFLLALFPNIFTLQINSVLFGDILIITKSEILILYLIAICAFFLFLFNWRKWIMVAIDQDFARSRGVNSTLANFIIILMLAIFISFAINIVGVLLAAAFLVLPAATARILSNNPIQMVVLSLLVAFICGIFGVFLSIKVNAPTGVSIVVTLGFCLLFCFCYKSLTKIVHHRCS